MPPLPLSAFQRPPTPNAAFQRPSTQHPRTLRAFQTSLQVLQVSLRPCPPRATGCLPSSDHPRPTQPSSDDPRGTHACCMPSRRLIKGCKSHCVHLDPKRVRYEDPGGLAQQQQPCDALRPPFRGLGWLPAYSSRASKPFWKAHCPLQRRKMASTMLTRWIRLGQQAVYTQL